MHALLLLAVLAEVRLEHVRESLTGTHCRYREYVGGFPTDAYVMTPCAEAPPQVTRLRGAGRPFRREIVEERPLQPFAYDYDPRTGVLLRTMPLYFNGKPARVFDPNPVASENDPSLQDQNDAAFAVPPSAYRDVELTAEESGPLRGPHATMVDRQTPNVAPPDAGATLLFDRQQDGFEDVNAYFHIDRNQRYLQSLGYAGTRRIVPYSIEVDAHAASGTDNSFFIPSATAPGRGTLYFGEGGTDDAEDADLVVHEYGHAILEWIAPGTFTGSFGSESRALAEGFGDYWAFSAHRAARVSSGRDPFCFADWDTRCWLDDPSQNCSYPPGADCLRRLDSTRTMADYDFGDTGGVEHRNGAIWSSALRAIFETLMQQYPPEQAKRIADTLVIESLFDTPPHPTFAIMADRLLQTDLLLNRGANASKICAAMTARGILTTCGSERRGEITAFQSAQRALPIPENDVNGVVSRLTIDDERAIERLFVRVDIEHPSRGDLKIELITPSGMTLLLQQVSFERTPDIHVTFGVDAASVQPLDVLRGTSAAGEWRLVVRDLRALDAGTLQSWGLEIQFQGDEPLNERPRGARAQMLPVVAHLYGALGSSFASAVRIANPSTERRNATLVYTPSTRDGLADFLSVQIALDPGQTVAFDDVVSSLFHTVGSGTLQVLGEVVVMSRTYSPREGGTLGEEVPPNLETTARGEAPLLVAPFLGLVSRENLGITEVSGRTGVVSVRVGSADERVVTIAPFSHVQFPIEPHNVEIAVIDGDARVSAYLSEVHDSGDPMFIPAVTRRENARRGIAPVISNPWWRSDASFSTFVGETAVPLTLIDTTHRESLGSQAGVWDRSFYIDVAERFWFRSYLSGAVVAELPAGVIGATAVAYDAFRAYVPFLDPDGPAEQHLVFIESGNGYRTNIGFVSETAAAAEVTVYDAGGVEVERKTLTTWGGSAQTNVSALVSGGRATVRFLVGRGRAYASMVDNVTRDATFVAGQ